MLIVGGNQSAGGYEVDNSCRFNNGSSDSLTRTTTGSVTNAKIATFSAWIKRSSQLNQNISIWGEYDDTNNRTEIGFNSTNDHFYIFGKNSGSTYVQAETNASFRDVSAWYHFVLAYDSTDGTSSNRVKIYVNGVQITSFASTTYPSLNTDLRLNSTSKDYAVGDSENSDHFWDGYMAEVLHIDGQALDPTSFGEFDADTGIWKPIDVSGLTFGTNGYYLDFENSAALGDDVSGNGNNFTVNNLTSVDQTTDTPTNNFATINALDNYWAGATLEEGNTKVTTGASNEAMSTSTFAMTSGKWYMEVDNISGTGAKICGITPTVSFQTGSHGKSGDVTPHTISYIQSGQVQEGDGSGGQTTLATYASYTNGDIIGIYMDLDNMKAYLSKNGALQSSTGIDLEPLASNGTGYYMFFVGDYNIGTRVCEANFGNGFQTLSSAVSDDNGYGAFEYSPNITGDGTAKSFYACCTKNLAEYG